jgi:hypothetical protein
MAKDIELKVTKIQFEALLDMMETVRTAFEQVPEEYKNVKALDRMLKKNGYKRG